MEMEQFHTSIGLSPNESILSNGYMYLVPYIAGDLDPVESNRSFYVHLYLDQDPGSDAKFSKAFMKNVVNNLVNYWLLTIDYVRVLWIFYKTRICFAAFIVNKLTNICYANNSNVHSSLAKEWNNNPLQV